MLEWRSVDGTFLKSKQLTVERILAYFINCVQCCNAVHIDLIVSSFRAPFTTPTKLHATFDLVYHRGIQLKLKLKIEKRSSKSSILP